MAAGCLWVKPWSILWLRISSESLPDPLGFQIPALPFSSGAISSQILNLSEP